MARRLLAVLTLIPVLIACVAGPAHAQLRTRVYASGFTNPLAFVQDPTDRTVQYVVQQGGRIRAVRSGTVLSPDFLNLTSSISSGGERGLLGLAFAPDYATSGRFYVNFTNTAGNTVVARFKRSANPVVADASTRFDLDWSDAPCARCVTQPFANHNGGNLVFGPDGFLYIGLGDGGSGNDPSNNAQTKTQLLGKMLRIDVNVPDADPIGYQVPATNPFVGGSAPVAGARTEIWDFGLRNPWRYSFDDPARGGTGALVIADVGQGSWEEIDYEPAGRGGRNYGWSTREGAHNNPNSSATPAYLPLTDPIHEYDHTVGQSITGGYVYRGGTLGPAYRGRYFFADFVAGRLWSMAFTIGGTGEAMAAGVVEHTAELGGTSQLGNISSFGLDADGELHVVSYSRGMILRIFRPQVSSDFDGDGRADLSVFRPCTGTWFVNGSAPMAFGAPGDIPVPADYDGDGKTDLAVFRPSTGVWFVLGQGGVQFGAPGDIPVPGDYGTGRAQIAVFRRGTWFILGQGAIQWGEPGDIPVPADYNGDGRIDVAVYRPGNGVWFVRNQFSIQWGALGDVPVPQDVDGDGRAELVVYRAAANAWFSRNSATGATTLQRFGALGDVPVLAGRLRPTPAGDFDGDGRADISVYRPSGGTWWTLQSATQFTAGNVQMWGGNVGDVPVPADYVGLRRLQMAVFRGGTWLVNASPTLTISWGQAGDVPVPADYDGDGRADLAVFRSGRWLILFSSSGFTTSTTINWGQAGDIAASGDFDGDGKADLAVFRSGVWFVLFSASNYTTSTTLLWGAAGDIPVAADYDGDGATDLAVYRPSNGTWYIRPSSTGAMVTQLFGGEAGDVPVPGDFDGDGRADIAIFRPTNATWFVLGQRQAQWGAPGDVPILERP